MAVLRKTAATIPATLKITHGDGQVIEFNVVFKNVLRTELETKLSEIANSVDKAGDTIAQVREIGARAVLAVLESWECSTSRCTARSTRPAISVMAA